MLDIIFIPPSFPCKWAVISPEASYRVRLDPNEKFSVSDATAYQRKQIDPPNVLSHVFVKPINTTEITIFSIKWWDSVKVPVHRLSFYNNIPNAALTTNPINIEGTYNYANVVDVAEKEHQDIIERFWINTDKDIK